ncbi:MAG: sugar ABC transporter ATP-binding protein [Spirochaetales bacterium]|nr:sugar ABC transporter ATP-binding protein [Spirochaetales bacterium]
MNVKTPILELKMIKKRYPGVQALNGVNLDFKRGEIHGLIGENGAGKSTLIKIIAGVTRADEGTILRNGKKIKITNGKDAYSEGFSFIHQELNLIPYFNSMENIFLGHTYPKNTLNLISWKKLKEKTESILDLLGIKVEINKPVSKLSPGNQAMIAIARAFAMSASVFFMDEPTASLTDDEKERLFSVIKSLKNSGATIVYVTHHLKEIIEITDRVSVMRDGEVIGTWKKSEVTEDMLIRNMIGRKIESIKNEKIINNGKPVLVVDNLCCAGLKNISFTVHKGEIFGVAGLVGSGRTELLRMIYGVEPIADGSIYLNGEKIKPKSPKDSIKKGIVYVPEERRTQGLILNMSVRENITLLYLKYMSYGFFLNEKLEDNESKRVGESVKLKTAGYKQRVNTLSGGNQQKVVFAKCLIRKPKVLMLDEPTRGVDVSARFEIHSIIRKLASQGTAVILVSSDLNEFLELADKFIVLNEGTQKGTIKNLSIGEEKLLMLCYGKEFIDERETKL